LPAEIEALRKVNDAPAAKTLACRDRNHSKGKTMKIEFPYEMKNASEVAAGSFFVSHEDDVPCLFLRLATKGEQEDDAVAFMIAPRPDKKLPALTSISSLEREPVAEIRNAIVRPSFSNLIRGANSAPIGSIAFQPNKVTLWASSSRQVRTAIDLADGTYTEPRQQAPLIYVTKWEVGFRRDDGFETLFKFDWEQAQLAFASIPKAG
jgi:hypothetical protein